MDASAQPLTMDSLVALIFLGVVALASLLIGLFWLAGRLGWLDEVAPAGAPSVNRSALSTPRHYDKGRAAPLAERGAFRASRPEAEAEARPEAARKLDPEAPVGFVTISEKALQERDAEKIEEGMVRMFAIFERRGLIPPKQGSALKEAAFGVSGGRRLQRLNARIDAVAGQVDAPAPEPAPALTPLAGRPVPAGVQFPDDE